MSSITVAIAGFTGKMARLITTSLLQNHPKVTIHGICRSAEKLDESTRSNPQVKVFEAQSTDSAALRKALAGTSVAICCYLGDNTLMVDGQKTLIDACIAENVPRYIASDYTLDFRGLKFGDHPAKDAMKHVKAYLEEDERKDKVKGVHILNGAFMEVVWAPFLGFINAAGGVFRYYGTGDEPLEMTTYKDTAKLTAEVAVDSDVVGAVKYLGDCKSVKELAKIYQDVYGVEPKVERLGSLEDLYATMTCKFKENPANVFAWMGMYYQYYMLNGQTLLGKTDNKRYPQVVPTTVAEFLKLYTKDTVGNSARF